MSRLTAWRSIQTRLTVLFFAITLVAIAVIYVYVAPSLQANLRDQTLNSLDANARAALPLLSRTVGSTVNRAGVAAAVRSVADRTSAHVTLLGVSSGTAGLSLYPIADSGLSRSPEPGRMDIARRAAAGRTGLRGTTHDSGGPAGLVALPIVYGGRVARVTLFGVSLRDVQSNVGLIRRRILVAGLIALAFALLAGTVVARALSRRIKRLERAARRVAAGDFSAGFPRDARDDELGELALALDDMQRQLEELDTARKRFIATASHELRTPIFSLGGFLELIQDEELDEDTRRQFVGQVRAQVDRLGKLATGLLDLSRLEAGAIELSPRSTDLGVLSRAVTAEFIPALNQHGSHLELRVVREPIRAVCDPERVAQVLRILIDNALTHTQPGTRIVVTAARDQPPGRGVSLAVLDRGGGIPPGAADRIFDPFFTSDGVQGSGLGLAIARELADRMHAELTVSSKPGETTFTLRLSG